MFDPPDDEVPFGLQPPGHVGGPGLVLAPGVISAVLIPANPVASETVSISLNATLADDGSTRIEVSEDRAGLAAAEAITGDETVPGAQRTGALERRIQRRVPLISDRSWENSSDWETRHWSSTSRFSAQYFGKQIPGGR